MPALENTRHEKFAQAVASGMSKAGAYKSVYGNVRNPRGSAADLFRDNPNISSRVQELQAEAAKGSVLTNKERREFLARCVRVDLNAIDLDKDGDLIQEKIVTSTEIGTTVKVKLPGKRECIMSDAELAGELQTAQLNIGVGVNISVMTEERRAELMRKKQAALDRKLRPAAALNGNGTNAHN